MSDGPVGILAGGGGLPLEIARGIVARGRGLHIVAIDGEADADFSGFPHTIVNWGQIGGMVAAFRKAGCIDLVIVGRVKRPDLRRIKPDLGLFLSLPKIVRLITAGGDDGVLRRVVRFFEGKGFRVVAPSEVAPEIVVREGALGRSDLGRAERADVRLALDVIATLGAFDIGQGAVVRHGRILALEGAEGTDGMLARIAVRQVSDTASGPALRAGVLVKRPKPGQELRIDLPAIGPNTVRLAASAGLAAIAVAADNVLVAERATVRNMADAAGLAVVGTPIDPVPRGMPARKAGDAVTIALNGQEVARRDDIADARRGCGVLAALAPHCRSQGVVVIRRHVLAIETGEGLSALLERAAGLRQWGDRAKRRGALVIGHGAVLRSEHVEAAGRMGLAGIVSWGESLRDGAARSMAARLGLFVGEAPLDRELAG